MLNQKSFRLKPGEVEKKWYVIDAEDQVLGRMATQVANVLSGKRNPQYTPNVDSGDYVIIINADKVKLTGKKADKKIYRRFSKYPGHMKEIGFKEMIKKHPERVVRLAIQRMLPKNRLGTQMYKKLKVYAGSEHPHAAQNPEKFEV